MRQIIVIVDQEGNVKLEGKGFKGKGCEKPLQALEEALGVVKSKNPKPEFYVQETGRQFTST